MNELSNTTKTMSSREIAHYTGKEHKHVMRDIRNAEPSYMEVYGTESKFGLSEYKDSTGRTLPEYQLTKSQTLFLISGYDAVTRARIQKRWEELEAKFRIPQSYAEALKLAAEQAEALELKEKQNKQLLQENETKQAKIVNQNLQLRMAAPKVEKYDQVIETPDCFTTTTIAKEFGMSAQGLHNLLNDMKVMFKRDNHWVLFSRYHNQGYTKTRTTTYTDAYGNDRSTITTVWTQKGRMFIHDLLNQRKIG